MQRLCCTTRRCCRRRRRPWFNALGGRPPALSCCRWSNWCHRRRRRCRLGACHHARIGRGRCSLRHNLWRAGYHVGSWRGSRRTGFGFRPWQGPRRTGLCLEPWQSLWRAARWLGPRRDLLWRRSRGGGGALPHPSVLQQLLNAGPRLCILHGRAVGPRTQVRQMHMSNKECQTSTTMIRPIEKGQGACPFNKATQPALLGTDGFRRGRRDVGQQSRGGAALPQGQAIGIITRCSACPRPLCPPRPCLMTPIPFFCATRAVLQA